LHICRSLNSITAPCHQPLASSRIGRFRQELEASSREAHFFQDKVNAHSN